MLKNILAAAGLLALPFAAVAAVLPPSSLCDPVSGCQLTSTIPQYSSDQVAIYTGFDSDTQSPTVWSGYNLGTQSQYYQPANYDSNFGPAYTTPLSGTLWLKTQAVYSGQGDFAVDVYSPDTAGNYREQHFLLSSDALLSGHGYAKNSGGAGEVPWDQIIISGNMAPDNYETCIECGWDIELNLVNLSYIGNDLYGYMFQINPDDARSLVYREKTTYYYGDEYTYSISSVPLPASAWLFATAVLGLMVPGARSRLRQNGR